MRNLFFAAVVLTVLASSCKLVSTNENYVENGKRTVRAGDNYTTRIFEGIGDFSSLRCSLACDIEYVQGPASLEVYTSGSIMEHILADVDEDGILDLRSDVKFTNVKKLNVRISSPVLESVEITGAASFTAGGGTGAEDFSIVVSGAGDVLVVNPCTGDLSLEINGAADATVEEVDCSSVKVSISGAADCTLSGRTGSASVTINGTADVDLRHLQTDDLSTSISGPGRVRTAR